DITGRIGKLPLLLARGRIQAGHHFLVRDAMEEDKPVARNRGTAEARAYLFLPAQRWAFLRPGRKQARFRRNAVSLGPEMLRPIPGPSGQGQRDAGKNGASHESSAGTGHRKIPLRLKPILITGTMCTMMD